MFLIHKNRFNDYGWFLILLSTTLPIGKSGSFFDYIVFPLFLTSYIASQVLLRKSFRSSIFVFLSLLFLVPLVINIFTCTSNTVFSLALFIRTLLVIFCLQFLRKPSTPSLFHPPGFFVIIWFYLYLVIGSSFSLSLGFTRTFSTPLIAAASFNGDPHVFGPILAFGSTFIFTWAFYSRSFRLIKENTFLLYFFIASLLLIFSVLTGSRGTFFVYLIYLLFVLFSNLHRLSIPKKLNRSSVVIFTFLSLLFLSIIIITLTLFTFGDSDSGYNFNRTFSVLGLFDSSDLSRSHVLSNALTVASEFFLYLSPLCNPITVADNGFVFIISNLGLLFLIIFYASLFALIIKSTSFYSRFALSSIMLFTTIASEAVFLPRFIIPICLAIYYSERTINLSSCKN